MCGRYYLDTENDKETALLVAKAANVAERFGIRMKTNGDIRPTEAAPVLAPSSLNRELIPFPMIWGFPHPKKKDILVFNTRSETANEKDFFCTSLTDRRCTIPFSGYYEWCKNATGQKDKYVFRPSERCYLAGLYIRKSGRPIPCFSILTADAPEGLKQIHARMPVLIAQSQLDDWMSAKLPIEEAGIWAKGNVEITATQVIVQY